MCLRTELTKLCANPRTDAMRLTCCDAPEPHIEADSSTVCARCGSVLESDALVNDGDFAGGVTNIAAAIQHRSGSQYHEQGQRVELRQRLRLGPAPRELRAARLNSLVVAAASGLRLPQTLPGRAVAMAQEAQTALAVGHGRRGLVCVCVCVHVACKQLGVAKPIAEILAFFGVDFLEFTRMYAMVRPVLVHEHIPPLGPEAYIPRLCHALVRASMPASDDGEDASVVVSHGEMADHRHRRHSTNHHDHEDGDDGGGDERDRPSQSHGRQRGHISSRPQQALERLSTAALRMVKHVLLHIGRHEEPIAVACVALAQEATTARRITTPDMTVLASSVGCRIALAHTRTTECRNMVLALAQRVPCFQHVCARDLSRTLLDILRRVDPILNYVDRRDAAASAPPESSSSSSSSCTHVDLPDPLSTLRVDVPTSFSRACAHRIDLAARIARSRRRVSLMRDPITALALARKLSHRPTQPVSDVSRSEDIVVSDTDRCDGTVQHTTQLTRRSDAVTADTTTTTTNNNNDDIESLDTLGPHDTKDELIDTLVRSGLSDSDIHHLRFRRLRRGGWAAGGIEQPE